MSTADAERIAELLRADAEAPRSGRPSAMSSLFAETIELSHVPSLPADGPITADLLRAISAADMAAVSRGLLNLVAEKATVTVEASSIRIRSSLRGNLATGKPIKVDNDVLIEIRDGKIVALQGHRDEDSWAQWFEVLEAGDFDPPAEWLARGGHSPAGFRAGRPE
ncbi:MAG: hypothetical protein ACLQRH_27755 [Acidimicrobiales bacterium]|jgi:hypothetical protein